MSGQVHTLGPSGHVDDFARRNLPPPELWPELILDQPENQPHRADLAKMLVHRRARRQGLGQALMRAAEATARACGKTLLVLDAVTGGDAARLYERLGWVRVGDIPGYALMPRGGFCSTTYYYRDLGSP